MCQSGGAVRFVAGTMTRHYELVSVHIVILICVQRDVPLCRLKLVPGFTFFAIFFFAHFTVCTSSAQQLLRARLLIYRAFCSDPDDASDEKKDEGIS